MGIIVVMVHDFIIRGFDDDIHSQLGDLSRQKGVSINSIVKDAVDKWLKQQKEIPKRHYLLIYDNDESMKSLLKSMDELAQKGEWFRCFVRSSDYSIMDLLERLNWFDGTKLSSKYTQKDFMKYCSNIVQNISKNSGNKEVYCVDFLMNDIATTTSMKEAIKIDRAYDENKLEGIVFCACRANIFFDSPIGDMLDLFDSHEQIFIIKDGLVYKLHISRESVHKLFLN
jgi:hypothetical protein